MTIVHDEATMQIKLKAEKDEVITKLKEETTWLDMDEELRTIVLTWESKGATALDDHAAKLLEMQWRSVKIREGLTQTKSRLDKELTLAKTMNEDLEKLCETKQESIEQLEDTLRKTNEQAQERETKLRLRLRTAEDRAVPVAPKAADLMGLEYEEANAKQRAGSVQPGMLVPQYVEMHFPITWEPSRVIEFVNKSSPCPLSSMTGPKRMQLDGVDVNLYGITLQDDVARNAANLKSTLMENLMDDAKDDVMPQKLKDRYSKAKGGKNKLTKSTKDEGGDENMSRGSASPARSTSSASSNDDKSKGDKPTGDPAKDKPRDKSPEIYRELKDAKLSDKDSYGGRVHKSPHQVDLESMGQKQLIDYCHA